MTNYLFIESRDPFEHSDVLNIYDLAQALVHEGNHVTLFLIHNGVFPARRSARSEVLTRLANAGVILLADDFSLRERGIRADRLTPEVHPKPLDVVIDHLAGGSKVVWH